MLAIPVTLTLTLNLPPFPPYPRPPQTSSELDSARFFKLCTDARLIDARFGRTQCDLVFTRAATQKRLGWAAFRAQAIPYVADGKNVSEESVLAAIASVQCVSSTGTVPDAVRFHDDKTTYTGTHGVGGPTTIDGVITLSNLADRSDANVRGIKRDAMLVPLRGRAGTSTDDRRRSSSSAAAAAALRPTSSSPIRRDSAAGARRDSSAGAAARRDSGAAAAAAQQQQRKSSLSAAGGTIAGSANRAGGVYDRLCNTNSYTGVYAERFKGGAAGGRINDDTVNCGPRGFSGHTNAGGDHIVRDISQICRR
ncbi:p25-alpha-domain-containing protein [Tribonema minus]|uniref:p25-alpha-domain-containing protein n=1 Tax=Tribonema minus TaxID=303371 RepID=A0A835YWX0_9STRA|nr:p25-alpha-domain-containing protein [Tribonema minus]